MQSQVKGCYTSSTLAQNNTPTPVSLKWKSSFVYKAIVLGLFLELMQQLEHLTYQRDPMILYHLLHRLQNEIHP